MKTLIKFWSETIVPLFWLLLYKIKSVQAISGDPVYYDSDGTPCLKMTKDEFLAMFKANPNCGMCGGRKNYRSWKETFFGKSVKQLQSEAHVFCHCRTKPFEFFNASVLITR